MDVMAEITGENRSLVTGALAFNVLRVPAFVRTDLTRHLLSLPKKDRLHRADRIVHSPKRVWRPVDNGRTARLLTFLGRRPRRLTASRPGNANAEGALN